MRARITIVYRVEYQHTPKVNVTAEIFLRNAADAEATVGLIGYSRCQRTLDFVAFVIRNDSSA
jgi:hypothetical protein